MNRIGVVILNYKLKEEADRAISSVFLTGYDELEVILVDNNSKDGCEELVKKYPKLHFIEAGENKGFSGGCNMGIKIALELKCNFVMLLNPDAWLKKDCLTRLVQGALETGAGIMGPKIYFPDKKTILYAGGNFDLKNVLGSHRGVDQIDDGRFDEVVETDFVTGGVMFVDKSVFQKIGLLDESYFLYYEDVDFCYRARQMGFKIMFYPKAVAYHESGKITGVGSPLQDYYITRNRMIFAKKFLSFRTQIALFREALRNIKNIYRRKALFDYWWGNFGGQTIK